MTGNVAGGRGFRGSVGYTADRDFRGALGSDSTFRFEADSAYSNIVFNTSNYSRDRFLLAQATGSKRTSTARDLSSSGQGDEGALAMGLRW